MEPSLAIPAGHSLGGLRWVTPSIHDPNIKELLFVTEQEEKTSVQRQGRLSGWADEKVLFFLQI